MRLTELAELLLSMNRIEYTPTFQSQFNGKSKRLNSVKTLFALCSRLNQMTKQKWNYQHFKSTHCANRFVNLSAALIVLFCSIMFASLV